MHAGVGSKQQAAHSAKPGPQGDQEASVVADEHVRAAQQQVG